MTRKQIGAVLGAVVLATAAALLTLALLHGRGGDTEAAGTGQYCTAPDDGSGTTELPADCDYVAPDEPMKIIEGLPSGTTIELDPILDDFDCSGARLDCSISLSSGQCEGSGGLLGGTASCADATLDLVVTGTGELTGFNRHLSVPIFTEFHWDSRNQGDPVQAFDGDVYHLRGQLYGDPDFCEFIITAGTDYSMPSPGETTLTEQPSGDYAVDSFFDVTYQIEFEGCPGSQLDGYAGTTEETVTVEFEVTEWSDLWSELRYPPGHAMEGQSIDLAFEIWAEELLPPVPPQPVGGVAEYAGLEPDAAADGSGWWVSGTGALAGAAAGGALLLAAGAWYARRRQLR